MESEIGKIQVEKDEKMKMIHESGDRLTEIIDTDRHMRWTKNKELKELRQENLLRSSQLKDLGTLIYPVERRFNREKTDWEFRIEDMVGE